MGLNFEIIRVRFNQRFFLAIFITFRLVWTQLSRVNGINYSFREKTTALEGDTILVKVLF